MKYKGFIKFILALLLIIIIMTFLYKNGYFSIVEKITIADFLFLNFLTLLTYFVAGFQMFYLVKKQNGISISLIDRLLLPASMSLFAYIIPTNGGLLYSVFFLKKKYNIDSSKGFSIGIVSIYISFIITGIFGITTCLYTDTLNLGVLTLSIGLIFASLIIHIINTYLQKFKFKESTLFYKIQHFINEIFTHSNFLMINRTIVFSTILINSIYFLLSFTSYQCLNTILDLHLPLTSVFLILLISNVSSLVRLLPGNLGLEELYMGSIFKIIGRDPGIGVIFSLILRISSIVLFVPLGIFHFFINLEHIKFSELKNILNSKN